MHNTLLRLALIGSVLGTTLLGSVTAQAALVDNQQLVQQAQTDGQRQAIHTLLARADVRDALAQHGVDQNAVAARVDRMTAAELQEMHARLAELPAGANSGVGLVLGIIFIFIVLDLLGATDVFPRI